MFRFTPGRCPECGGRPCQITEQVLVGAPIAGNDRDGYDYEDASDVSWDTQEPQYDGQGRVELACRSLHVWWATMTEVE